MSFFVLFYGGCDKKTDNKDDDNPNDTLALVLEIHVINIGQGDCTLVKTASGKTLLIDAGANGQGNRKVIPYLDSLGVDSLQYVIATHYHTDHIGGLDEVLNNVPVSREVLDRGGRYSSTFVTDYIDAAGDKRRTITRGEVFELDSLTSFRCVAVNGNGRSGVSENDLSVAIVVSCGNFDYFTGGDLSGYTTGDYTDMETALAPSVGVVEAFKVGHHGSYSSTNLFFMRTLMPKAAMITVGLNSFGHPHSETITTLNNERIDYYQTATGSGAVWDGDIVISYYGTDFFNVTSRRRDKDYSTH
jgi:beta-lactamase superfamily II metal-dependent hydrolase